MPLGWLLRPAAVASTLALSTLGLLSRRYRRARFYFNLTLYVSTLAANSVWGVVVSILATAAGQRLNINYLVARSFYRTCSPQIGVTFNVEGEEHLAGLLTARGGKPQSAVLVGNHQSFLDILYIGRIFPKRAAIMAKQELQWTPLLGQFMSLSGAVFINRKNRKHALAAMEQAGNDMKKRGVSLWVFPEGTRSSSAEPALLPFKKGAFHLAVQAQVPIVPVVCENYHRLFDGRTRFEPGQLKLRVLPPIPTAGLTTDDVTALTESTREMMLETLRDISQPGPSGKRTQIASPAEPLVDDKQPEQDQDIGADLVVKAVDESSDCPSVDGADATDDVISRSSGNDSTEDEMDDDAVLLKRPGTSAAA
ncbi:hypothetical protein IAU60_000256 [Kwoniella sp. DSM 27419]